MAELSSSADTAILPPGVSRCSTLSILGITRKGRLKNSMPTVRGIDPDMRVGAIARTGHAALLASAPGEWLLLVPAWEVGAHFDQGPGFLVADLSHGRTILRLAPAAARPAVAAFSPLDPATEFRADSCAHTLFGDADVLLVAEPGGGLLLIGEIALEAYLLALLAHCLGK